MKLKYNIQMKYDYIPKTNIKMIHINNSYSFGIDSILLTHFAKMNSNKTLIDIRAGTGILSLKCNYLYNLKKVYAIEIQKKKCDILSDNLKMNSINNIEIINKDLNNSFNDFKENSIDYIITNPPYYKVYDNLDNLNDEFNISRKEIYMNLDDIFKFSNQKLKDKGKLYMIHKPERIIDIIKKSGNMKLKTIKFINSRYNEKPQLVLLEFVKNAKDGLKFKDPIIIYENGNYTKEINDIYGI